ncbi:hypothetical protein WKW50_22165 [Ochrobactrum sp. GPK 3]
MAELLKLLTQLQWSTLLAFAAGYAGYFVANVGLRTHHRSIDITFSALIFGVFGAFAYDYCSRKLGWSLFGASAVGFFVPIIIGGLWAWKLRSLMYVVFRKLDISHSDEVPTAWKAVFQATKARSTQLDVKLIDGTWLRCLRLADFEQAPNGPCVFGNDGDIAMYVTHEKSPGDEDFEHVETVHEENWGYEMTFIPKEQIARVYLRRVFPKKPISAWEREALSASD